MTTPRIGPYIKSLREAKSLSAYRVSKLAEIDAAYLSKVENEITPPSDNFLQKVAPVLGVEYADLKKAVYEYTIPEAERPILADFLLGAAMLSAKIGSAQKIANEEMRRIEEPSAIKRLAAYVERRRDEVGLTIEALADAARLTPDAAMAIELGHVERLPTDSALSDLDSALKLANGTLDRIAWGKTLPQAPPPIGVMPIHPDALALADRINALPDEQRAMAIAMGNAMLSSLEAQKR